MKIDQLIAQLASDVPPVRRGAVGRRLALGVGLGAALSLAILLSTLHFRPDLWLAMQGPSFWMKWGYTASLAAVAIYLTSRLARPDPGALKGLRLIAIPVLILAGIGVVELVHTPPGEWLAMWLGKSWKQ